LNKFDVTIVGEINLDLILYGLPEQLPQERELLASDLNVTLGSSSAIVAHNLAALGTNVGFITRVGSDPLGKIALDRLGESGVDLSKVVTAETSTTGLTVILPHGKERHILTYPGTMFEMNISDLDFEYLLSAKHFHMSSLFLHKALTADIPGLFARMKHAGLSTSLDTNDDPDDGWDGVLDDVLPHVDVLLPNAREACKIARTESLSEAINTLAKKVSTLAVKLGAGGALGRRGVEEVAVPSLSVDVLDSVGAGDSFDAGFLSRYIKGASLAECLENGNLTGALSTQKAGGTEAFRNPEFMQQFFSRHESKNLRMASSKS
jgi:sugar/nucleoside kinase (ribokinase family)